MTNHIKPAADFVQKRPGFYSSVELAAWLGVSRNSIREIANRFGLKSIEGHYPEADVWRKILTINAHHEEDRRLLRDPLKKSGWVARRTRVPSSTMRSKIRKGTFEYPHGVQLAKASEDSGHPRSRRWMVCIIDALADGRQPPDFQYLDPSETTSHSTDTDVANPAHEPANNVFAKIARSNAEDARQ